MRRTDLSAVILAALLAQVCLAGPGRGLSDEPLVAEALGLEMYLPAGATTSTQVGEGTISYLVRDEASSWSMRIDPLVPAVEAPTAAAVAAEHLKAIGATGRSLDVLVDGPRLVGGLEGHALFVRQGLDDGRELVNGWLILPTSDRTFVAISVVAAGDRFERLSPVLEACFDTIELRSLDQSRRDRQRRLEIAREFVATLTAKKLRSLVGRSGWYRIYQPANTGRLADDTEVGFLSMTVKEGMRGQLTPEREPASFGKMEAEQGLLVIIEARAIISADKQHYLDVDGRYWAAWDRGAEAWSIRQTQRVGAASQTSAETGVRNRLTLDVIHSSREQLTRDPSRWTIPDTAYLSQPEVLLLGALLPRDGSLTGEFVFYYYDTRSRRLAERVDRWEPADDGSGRWELTSRPILEATTITQEFDARGERIRRIDGDGTVTERIDADELARLWAAKGLLAR